MQVWPAEVDTLALSRGCRRYLADKSGKSAKALLHQAKRLERALSVTSAQVWLLGQIQCWTSREGNVDYVFLAHQPLLKNTRLVF